MELYRRNGARARPAARRGRWPREKTQIFRRDPRGRLRGRGQDLLLFRRVEVQLVEDQKRKGGDVPYVSHLIGVASIVLEHGGDEDQAIGALLHDALEDQAHKMSPNEIRARFGDRVEAIVEACTDGNPEEQRDRDPARWRVRKQIYIDQVATKPADALLVSMADKLYNARAILEDFRELGDKLWPRFTAGKEGTLWYYRSLLTAFRPRARTSPSATRVALA